MNDFNQNNPSSQVPDNESGEYEHTPEEKIDALNNALKAFQDLNRAIGDLPGKPDDSDYATSLKWMDMQQHY